MDAKSGIILMEWIDGLGSVREVLGGLPEEEDNEDESEEQYLAREKELEERLRKVTLNEGKHASFSLTSVRLIRVSYFVPCRKMP